jgi:hypothetical protein
MMAPDGKKLNGCSHQTSGKKAGENFLQNAANACDKFIRFMMTTGLV